MFDIIRLNQREYAWINENDQSYVYKFMTLLVGY